MISYPHAFLKALMINCKSTAWHKDTQACLILLATWWIPYIIDKLYVGRYRIIIILVDIVCASMTGWLPQSLDLVSCVCEKGILG